MSADGFRSATSSSERTDWLYGLGASSADRILVRCTAAAGLVLLTTSWFLDIDGLRTASDLRWWHLPIVVVLVIDVVGGVVANATDAAKRLYHGPLPADAGRFGRLVHGHLSFTAMHVHPIVAGLLFPGGLWWWGLIWYGWALGGVAVVRRVDHSLQRPIALAVVTVGIIVSAVLPAPSGLAWLPAALLLKLVFAHAVAEVVPSITAGGAAPR